MVGGRVGRYIRIGLYTTFGLFFLFFFFLNTFPHILLAYSDTCSDCSAFAAPSVVLQRLHLDLVPHAAPRLFQLAGRSRASAVRRVLPQTCWVLRF